MTPATKTLLMVVVASARGILEALRRVLVAFEKWLEAQDVSIV